MLNLGIIADPITNSTFGDEAIYFEKLAQEICDLLLEPLKVSQICGSHQVIMVLFRKKVEQSL